MQTNPIRIAIDAMGGDHAPDVPVMGALAAARTLPDARFVLVGDEEKLRPLIFGAPPGIEIRHAKDAIDAGAEPARSVRRQPDSSLVVCARMVKDGEADAMVSAGNTGAFMVAGLLIVGRMEGIDRPALAAMLPTFKGDGVLLVDAGANADASPQNLVEFAAMGKAYMEVAKGLEKVRIGLLNIGAEEKKGNELCKNAFPLLKERYADFYGNVEARDMLRGVCDVVVCDGFVGNVLVKFYEGVGVGLLSHLRDLFSSSFFSKLAALLLRGSFRRFRRRFDYAEHGGAPFLGVRGVLVKAHGSSNARAFEMALRQAHGMRVSDLVRALEREIVLSRGDRG